MLIIYSSPLQGTSITLVIGRICQNLLLLALCKARAATMIVTMTVPNFMPAGTGADFFEFIGLELIPYIDNNYRTAKFTIAVGHDFTANFINYFLFKDPPMFNGYINLSPDLAPYMDERLPERIPQIQTKTFYYLATGSDDVKDLREISEMLDTFH